MNGVKPATALVIGLLVGWIALRMIYIPGGLMAYIFPVVYWTGTAIIVIHLLGGMDSMLAGRKMKIIRMALLIAIIQLFITVDAGVINKFGLTPASITAVGIIINLSRIVSNLIGVEVSRFYLVKTGRRMSLGLVLGGLTLFYTIVDTSVTGILDFQNAYVYVKYLGETFLPCLAENLLATYLSFIGGPLAAISYRLPYDVFEWVSPILPDLPWGFKSLIGVMIPTMGFVVVASSTTIRDYVGVGARNMMTLRESPSESKSTRGSFILAIVLVAIIWSTTGLLGFQPNVVVSGSMGPTLEVGDVVVSVRTPIDRIREGDIILYRVGAAPIMHRVIEVRNEKGTVYFITKGDANPTPDEPVNYDQIIGKMVLAIPKVGWVPLHIKTALYGVLSLFNLKDYSIYVIFGLVSAGSIALTLRPARKTISRLRRSLG